MTAKVIQMTIDEALLADVDQVTREEGLTRSAFLRAALEEALARIRIRRLERQHAEAYARLPQSADEIEAWSSVQAWGEG